MFSAGAGPPAAYGARGMKSREARGAPRGPVAADESAAAKVADPDSAPHLRRDVAGSVSRALAWPGLIGRREFLAGQVPEQGRERAVDDRGRVAARDSVPQQI